MQTTSEGEASEISAAAPEDDLERRDERSFSIARLLSSISRPAWCSESCGTVRSDLIAPSLPTIFFSLQKLCRKQGKTRRDEMRTFLSAALERLLRTRRRRKRSTRFFRPISIAIAIAIVTIAIRHAEICNCASGEHPNRPLALCLASLFFSFFFLLARQQNRSRWIESSAEWGCTKHFSNTDSRGENEIKSHFIHARSAIQTMILSFSLLFFLGTFFYLLQLQRLALEHWFRPGRTMFNVPQKYWTILILLISPFDISRLLQLMLPRCSFDCSVQILEVKLTFGGGRNRSDRKMAFHFGAFDLVGESAKVSIPIDCIL